MKKLYHALLIIYHTVFRHFHRRPGNWQTTSFEYHHKRAKYYKERMKPR